MAQGDMYDHSGVISVTVPSGGYTKGKLYLLASAAIVVALETKAAAATCPVLTGKNMKSIWVAKVAGTGLTIAAGAKVYFKSASNAVTGTASGNTICGVCEEAATATATTVLIRFGETI